MVLPPALVPLSPDFLVLRPEPGSLSEKVSHLESMLRKLQEDLQKVIGGSRGVTGLPWEQGWGPATLTPASPHPPPPQEKADRAALEEEVRSLRHNNRRLQAESESAATRLLLASKQLGSPATDRA